MTLPPVKRSASSPFRESRPPAMDMMHLVAEEPLSGHLPFRTLLLLFLLGLGGWAATCHLVGVVFPRTARSAADQKLEDFLDNKDAFDVVVVGSSLVARSIVPLDLDEHLAQRGYPLASYNFGIPRMIALEQEYMLRKILESKPARLRYVVIAPDSLSLEIAESQLRNQRIVLWHDLRTTLFATSMILRQEDTVFGKIRSIGHHWNAWFLRVANIGEVRIRFDNLVRGPQADVDFPNEIIGSGGRGYVSIDEVVTKATKARRKVFEDQRKSLMRDLESYRERLEAKARSTVEEAPPSSFEAEFLRRIAGIVTDAGAVPIFLILPAVISADREFIINARRLGIIDHLIDLDDPNVYGETYAVENRWDRVHPNHRGARLITRLFGEKLAGVIEGLR